MRRDGELARGGEAEHAAGLAVGDIDTVVGGDGDADQLVLAVEDDLHGRQRGDRLHLGERGGPDGAQDGSEGEDDRAPVHRVAPAGSL